MITFEPLASSSAGCAYRLSGEGVAPLLIDCGLTFKELQKALDFRVSELAGCLISHSHGDHAKAWEGLSSAGVPIHAAHETWETLTPKAKAFVAPHALKKFDELFNGSCYMPTRIQDWVVTPFEAQHDCPGTLGFVIDSPQGDRLLYLTDSAYSKFRFPGLTHIAIECNHSMELMKANAIEGRVDRSRFSRTAHTHMSLERLIPLLKANDLSMVEHVWLLHLSDANSDEVEFKRAVERATGIPVTVAAKGGN